MTTETQLETQIQLEDGIPIPAKLPLSTRRASIYPFKSMKVNQSFLIPFLAWRKTYSQIHGYGRRNDKKFTARRVNDDSIRIWRVK